MCLHGISLNSVVGRIFIAISYRARYVRYANYQDVYSGVYFLGETTKLGNCSLFFSLLISNGERSETRKVFGTQNDDYNVQYYD